MFVAYWRGRGEAAECGASAEGWRERFASAQAETEATTAMPYSLSKGNNRRAKTVRALVIQKFLRGIMLTPDFPIFVHRRLIHIAFPLGRG
jgi:hypothetical protein